MSLPQLLSFVWNHPLNAHGRARAMLRLIRWQVASRLIGAPVALPFVDNTRLLMERGMTGATGNWYCGLQEFEEMGFLLHLLRPGDLFVDVGANVGSYTVLAGATGASVLAFEPLPGTFVKLERNVLFNRLQDRALIRNIGLAEVPGSLVFTTDLDTVNHVMKPGEAGEGLEVTVSTLDAELAGAVPLALKIDVEGYEKPVLLGATATLASPALKAVILETNGSGAGYGVADTELLAIMGRHGFTVESYDPVRRVLQPANPRAGNTLFLRDRACIEERLATSRRFRLVNGLT